MGNASEIFSVFRCFSINSVSIAADTWKIPSYKPPGYFTKILMIEKEIKKPVKGFFQSNTSSQAFVKPVKVQVHLSLLSGP
jgi:hypothetical protein